MCDHSEDYMLYMHHVHIYFYLPHMHIHYHTFCMMFIYDHIYLPTFSTIKHTSVSNHSHLDTGGSSKEETVHCHASLPSTSMQGNLNAGPAT